MVLQGQDPTGTLQGQVTDPSNAVVPHASLTIRNAATGFTTQQLSSNDGTFRFSSLAAGEYDLSASMHGFATTDAKHVRIDVNRVVDLPIRLNISSKDDIVEVQTGTANIDVSPTLAHRGKPQTFP